MNLSEWKATELDDKRKLMGKDKGEALREMQLGKVVRQVAADLEKYMKPVVP